MYPFLRFALEMARNRNVPPLGLFDTHVSHHRCLPWDLDPWLELNNGRTLTLYDLGRIPMAQRTGLIGVLRAQGWGITVAGNSTRYRKRVRVFERFELRSRCLGWDERFIYIEQGMWTAGVCANHILIRSAVTSRAGIVPPPEVVAHLGHPAESPALPDWVRAWIAADTQRPWPPVT
ncbi:MAG: acyl-CoA thioesterase [Roseinatronobacter sp.]